MIFREVERDPSTKFILAKAGARDDLGGRLGFFDWITIFHPRLLCRFITSRIFMSLADVQTATHQAIFPIGYLQIFRLESRLHLIDGK